jgi:RNA-directed DNA polymerase
VASLITQLVTVDNQLPQGAPTSTDIAALITFRLQRRLQGLAAQRGLKFTLYIDDLTFSGTYNLEGLPIYVRRIIESEGLHSNQKKEQIATKSHAQMVTGINIGHGFGISRKRRRGWRLERLNARKDNAIGSEARAKAERKYTARLNYASSVKAARHKKC